MAAIPMESLKARDSVWTSPLTLLKLAGLHGFPCFQYFSEILGENTSVCFEGKGLPLSNKDSHQKQIHLVLAPASGSVRPLTPDATPASPNTLRARETARPTAHAQLRGLYVISVTRQCLTEL